MELDDRDLQEFIAIWKQEFGENLTVAQACEYAQKLLALYELRATRVARERGGGDGGGQGSPCPARDRRGPVSGVPHLAGVQRPLAADQSA